MVYSVTHRRVNVLTSTFFNRRFPVKILARINAASADIFISLLFRRVFRTAPARVFRRAQRAPI